MAMSGYYVKNPGSTLDFTFDWDALFLKDGETIQTDLGWAVHPDGAGSGGLGVASFASTPTTTTVFLENGVSGEAYLASNTIVTDQGREIRRAITVRIANT